MLRQKLYNKSVDVFAAGCIFVELHTGDPVFPGSSETDMLHRISKLLGSVPATWKQGYEVAQSIGLTNLPGTLIEPTQEMVIQNLQRLMPQATPAALDLIYLMLSWDPRQRPTCMDALRHPYFSNGVAKNVNRGISMTSNQSARTTP